MTRKMQIVPVSWILLSAVYLSISATYKVADAYGFGPHSYSSSHPGICSQCPPGTGLLFLCNSTHDTVCEACAAERTFSPSHFHILSCSPCSLCGPGLYVDRKCTPSSDTLCDACQNKRSSYSWEYLASCRHEASPTAEDGRENAALLAEQETNLQILREELQLRNEFSALKSKVDEEALSIQKLGAAFSRMTAEPGSPSKRPSNDLYETNPKTVLAAAILVSFGLLGLGTVAVVWLILSWNKRRKIKTTYGGAKAGQDGITLLREHMENDSFDDDVVV